MSEVVFGNNKQSDKSDFSSLPTPDNESTEMPEQIPFIDLSEISGEKYLDNRSRFFLNRAFRYVIKQKSLSTPEKKALASISKLYFSVHSGFSFLLLMEESKIDMSHYKTCFEILDSLNSKHLINVDRNHINHFDFEISLTDASVAAMLDINNKLYEKDKSKNAIDAFFDFFSDYNSGFLNSKRFYELLPSIIDGLTQGEPRFETLFTAAKTDVERVMLATALHQAGINRGPVPLFPFLREVLSSYAEIFPLYNLVVSGETNLSKKGFLIFEKIGEGNELCFYLNAVVASKIIGDMFVNVEHLDYKNIRNVKVKEKKNLYFSGAVENSVNIISDSLSNDNYNLIRDTLVKNKMTAGVTILFSGAPGTGKTAKAEDIAKQSQRELFYVNTPSVRGKYVGESEKNAAAIFNEYEQAKNRLDKVPILFFNEADSLIGKRVESTDSIDQMGNSMQNVFLEKLEKFDGILIASTNFGIDSMDAAFSRRFIFKVEFEMPNAAVRKLIWKEKIKGIPQKILNTLGEIEISGGDIENISKQFIIGRAIGAHIGYSVLVDMAGSIKGSRNKVGFI